MPNCKPRRCATLSWIGPRTTRRLTLTAAISGICSPSPSTRDAAGVGLPASAWKPLKRSQKYTMQTKPRGRRERIKQQIVEERGFKDIRLVDEWIAERPYRSPGCKHTYRLIIVRKNLAVSEPQQQRLFDDYRYFLYITNDGQSTPEEIVFSANDRCQQENLIAQLKGDVRSLAAP